MGISSTIEYKIGNNRYFSVIHTFGIIEIAWNPPYFDSILNVKTLHFFPSFGAFDNLWTVNQNTLLQNMVTMTSKNNNVDSIASDRTFSWNIYLIDTLESFSIQWFVMLCRKWKNFLIFRLSNVYKWKMPQHLLALNMFNLLPSYFILCKNVKSFIHIVPPTALLIVMRPGNIFYRRKKLWLETSCGRNLLGEFCDTKNRRVDIFLPIVIQHDLIEITIDGVKPRWIELMYPVSQLNCTLDNCLR